LSDFERVVGKSWVFTSEDDLALYRDAYSPLWGETDERLAAAAVAPGSVEEVQEIVRIAARRVVPLYPISTGRNLGYGGSAPVLSGSVILDLKRMNRIIEVDEDNAFALVEPGVSYFDLYRYIREKNLRLWIDVPDPGWGSPIGNALEHGGGWTLNPFRDHFGAHCGMEVVLANGDLLRTGMGAIAGSRTWQQNRYGVGPYVDGLFTQSNFGIVTKMGFWLYPQPQAFRSGEILALHRDDVHEFVRITAELANAGIVNSAVMIRSPFLHAGLRDEQTAAVLVETEHGTAGTWDRLARDRGLASWATTVQFYGPPAVIAAQWGHVQERFAAIKQIEFRDGPAYRFPLSQAEAETVPDKSALGIPSLSIFAMGARSENYPSPADGHLSFSPVIPMTGKALLEAHRVFSAAVREWDIEPLGFGAGFCMYPRSFVFLFTLPLSRDGGTNRKARAFFRHLITLAAQHGWGEYRAHPVFMEEVMGVYSFNDHALRRFHQMLKDALDPEGILAAGRYGIWPKHLRNKRV
jgi:4-cresol dehydrogenase (hydroxylating)